MEFSSSRCGFGRAKANENPMLIYKKTLMSGYMKHLHYSSTVCLPDHSTQPCLPPRLGKQDRIPALGLHATMVFNHFYILIFIFYIYIYIYLYLYLFIYLYYY